MIKIKLTYARSIEFSWVKKGLLRAWEQVNLKITLNFLIYEVF